MLARQVPGIVDGETEHKEDNTMLFKYLPAFIAIFVGWLTMVAMLAVASLFH